MILTFVLAAQLAGAVEPSVLMKNIGFCLDPAFAPMDSRALDAACPGGRVVITEKAGTLEAIVENRYGRVSAYSAKASPADHAQVTLTGPELEAACGRPLALTGPKIGTKTRRLAARPMKLDAAMSTLALGMKSSLQRKVASSAAPPADGSIRACFSGLQTVIHAYKLDILSDAEFKSLKDAISPSKGVEPQSSTAE